MAAQGLAGFYGSVFKRSTTVGALIRNSGGSILLLRSGSRGWDLPAGIVKGAEDPRSAARRMARTALGLELDVGRVLVLDYIQAGGTAGAQGDSIFFVFDGGTLATSVAVFTAAGGEREARFVPVPDCLAALSPDSARRLTAALEALELGTVTELLDGEPARTESGPPPTRRLMPPVAGFSGILGR